MKAIRTGSQAAIVLAVAAAVFAFAAAGTATAFAGARPAVAHVTTRYSERATRGAKKQAVKGMPVKISNFKFAPAMITVKAGTAVVWTNRDAVAHSVNFNMVKINSKTLSQDARFSHTFTAPGTYTYICAIHPFMHGTVVVTA
jgi:amicyanin